MTSFSFALRIGDPGLKNWVVTDTNINFYNRNDNHMGESKWTSAVLDL